MKEHLWQYYTVLHFFFSTPSRDFEGHSPIGRISHTCNMIQASLMSYTTYDRGEIGMWLSAAACGYLTEKKLNKIFYSLEEI